MIQAKRVLPPFAVIALIVGVWWAVVVASGSVVFPTPWQVVTGTAELVRDGSLWEHIGASLFRVGDGIRAGVVVAVPLGLWMGWVQRRVHHPQSALPDAAADLADRVDPDRDPVVRRRQRFADLPDLHLLGIPDDRADHCRRAHDRAALPARGREFRRLAPNAVPPRGDPRRAAAGHRRHAHRPRRRLAGGGRGGDDRAALRPRLPHHRFAQRRQSLRPGDRRHDHHRTDRTAAGRVDAHCSKD